MPQPAMFSILLALSICTLSTASFSPQQCTVSPGYATLTCPDNWSCCDMPKTLVCADVSPPCTSCPDCCHSYLNASECSTCHATKCSGKSVLGDKGCNTTDSSTWRAYSEYCCGRGVPSPASTTLPNCLLIGDSVTHGLSAGVQSLLANECAVQLIIGNDAAGESACWGASRAAQASGQPLDWDVIHYNEGLHSLWPRVNTTDASGIAWAGVLQNWTQVLRLPNPTNGKSPSLIYATMTPMMEQRYCNPPGIPAHNVEALNALAVDTVGAMGVPINDLYSVITGVCGAEYVNCSLCDNESQYACPAYVAAGGKCGFHYVNYTILSESVAQSIRGALKERREQGLLK